MSKGVHTQGNAYSLADAIDGVSPTGVSGDDKPTPRVRCPCGTWLSSYTVQRSKRSVQPQKKEEVEAEAVEAEALDESAERPIDELADTEPAPPPKTESKPKKKGGNAKKPDPLANLCSVCRTKAQVGASVDAEDEERFLQAHRINHPDQARALAEQRARGRTR